VVSVTDHYDRFLDFLDRSRYFFFQVAPQLYSRGRVNTHYFSENLVATGIEPGPLDLQAGTLITRPQRRSYIYIVKLSPSQAVEASRVVESV
jgi:hypothetical protein